ncbi:MAG: hypothetical protein K2H56_01780 [Malacoplasma sp.]|nr:hypothetical protein [Malacoplasma sp.]
MNFFEENILEKKLNKRIDEKKLNSLKATTIAFLFFSTVAIILFILYLSDLNPGSWIYLAYYNLYFNLISLWSFFKLASFLSFVISFILAIVLIKKCMSISKEINDELKPSIIIFWIFFALIFLVAIFYFINLDIVTESVITIFAWIFSFSVSNITIKKVNTIKRINPKY